MPSTRTFLFFRTGDSLWFVLLGFAVITGSTNFHTDISLRTINHLLLLPLPLVRCARILRTRANVNIYTSFSGFAHSFSFNPVPVQSRMSEKLGAAKSYVIDC